MVQLEKGGMQQFLARSGPGSTVSFVGVVPRVPGEAQCEEAQTPEVLRHDCVLRAPLVLGSSQFGVVSSSGGIFFLIFWNFWLICILNYKKWAGFHFIFCIGLE